MRRSDEAMAADRAIRVEWVRQRRDARSARAPRLLHLWAGVELEISTHNLVVALAERGPMRLTDLAREVGHDLSTVSRQIAQPEALGLVERLPHAEGERGQKLRLTASGERLVERLVSAWDRLLDPVLEGWSDADLVRFAGYLTSFGRAVHGEIERHLAAQAV